MSDYLNMQTSHCCSCKASLPKKHIIRGTVVTLNNLKLLAGFCNETCLQAYSAPSFGPWKKEMGVALWPWKPA